MRVFLSILFISVCSIAFAQNAGNIVMHDEAGADDIIQKHIQFNREHNELPGYRIQILSTNKLQEAKDTKSVFLSRNDGFEATIIFDAPDYKVRIGNYNDRFEANRYLQEIITDYPNAFIVKDLINISHQ